MTFHPWHHLTAGEKAPKKVLSVIEIPKGSRNKYEIDKHSPLLILDRVLSSAVFYPMNYGFIPQTYCDDGDALDVMVLTSEPMVPLSLAQARVVGALKMRDGGEEDDKILAVYPTDPAFKHIESLFEVPQGILDEIAQFFASYKALEKKSVEISGWKGTEEAQKIVQDAMDFYQKNKAKLIS